MTIRTSGIDHVHFNVHRLSALPRDHGAALRRRDAIVGLLAEQFGFYNSCVYFREGDTKVFMDVFRPRTSRATWRSTWPSAARASPSSVALRVDDLEQAAEHAKRCGVAKEISRDGYRGMKQVQFDTFEDLGFNLEFVEYAPHFHDLFRADQGACREGETVDGLRYVDL
ncbi:MAG: hypothetical protein R3F16_16995 [Myxococcota bacterium]